MAQSNERGDVELTHKIYEVMQMPWLSERHDAIKALILADRKQHELEAKEAELLHTLRHSESSGMYATYYEKRIAELKAELEAL